MAGAEGAVETTLEHTPTWVVAAVCTVIVALSLLLERVLHFAGEYLIKKNQKLLFEALLKVKEELMLLGFISLLLTVSQSRINTICISKDHAYHWLPCKLHLEDTKNASSTTHRLLNEESEAPHYCALQGDVPLLSTKALHHLHIFIFVLAVVHVAFCALTILFGGAKIRQWKRWENSILNEYNSEDVPNTNFSRVKEHDFIRAHFTGIGKRSHLLGWMQTFFKQFYGSVTKSDYITLRHGFIMTHCKANPKFNFHNYMMRTLEDDFKRVVGISWYLWIFVVVFLLLNIDGWHAYFWLSFFPFVLLLAVGTKLEHVISQMAQQVAEKHTSITGDLVVLPSDDHFWFHSPRLVLILIHVILFQNSFELAFFFWIWVQYGFTSCIMGKIGYIVPRLVIGAFIQFFCSYSTLPLYAIITQMGTSFKKAIFEEHIQEKLVDWAQNATKNIELKKAAKESSHVGVGPTESPSSLEIQLTEVGTNKDLEMEEGNAGEIETKIISRWIPINN